MKIERINDSQIRCTLSNFDLSERNLNLSELAYGTEKARRLFREMVQKAYDEVGFDAEDIPLMVEAIPLSNESIMLVITKVDDPEEVDTQHESSLAALEGTLRSQGIPLFAGQFLLLWLAMSLALRRRYKQRMSAYAAASAYILCQYSFFMLFALLFSFGKSAEIGILLTTVLLMWDYHQWLGVRWKKSFWLVLKTCVYYGLLAGVVILLAGGTVVLIAYFQS